MKLRIVKLPNKKKINKHYIHREMLREAIALLFLETDCKSESYLRQKIRNTALTRIANKRK